MNKAVDTVTPGLATPGAPENEAGRPVVSIGDRVRKLLASDHEKKPLYPRVLRLRNVHPNGWQRAVLVEGMALAGGLVALADRASAWAPVILPAGAAVVVKFHDILAGVLPGRDGDDEQP